MYYIRFENVHCSYINLIDLKYSISSFKAFVHHVAMIHKIRIFLMQPSQIGLNIGIGTGYISMLNIFLF